MSDEPDIYVVVAENDQIHVIGGEDHFDPYGPVVFEQYTRKADLGSIKNRAARLSMEYGKCRIAKLVFIDD